MRRFSSLAAAAAPAVLTAGASTAAELAIAEASPLLVAPLLLMICKRRRSGNLEGIRNRVESGAETRGCRGVRQQYTRQVCS